MTAASYAKQFGPGSRKDTSNSLDIGMDIKTFGAIKLFFPKSRADSGLS
jgi:hypothetical protein